MNHYYSNYSLCGHSLCTYCTVADIGGPAVTFTTIRFLSKFFPVCLRNQSLNSVWSILVCVSSTLLEVFAFDVFAPRFCAAFLYFGLPWQNKWILNFFIFLKSSRWQQLAKNIFIWKLEILNLNKLWLLHIDEVYKDVLRNEFYM
jgi:hypothetical protein